MPHEPIEGSHSSTPPPVCWPPEGVSLVYSPRAQFGSRVGRVTMHLNSLIVLGVSAAIMAVPVLLIMRSLVWGEAALLVFFIWMWPPWARAAHFLSSVQHDGLPALRIDHSGLTIWPFGPSFHLPWSAVRRVHLHKTWIRVAVVPEVTSDLPSAIGALGNPYFPIMVADRWGGNPLTHNRRLSRGLVDTRLVHRFQSEAFADALSFYSQGRIVLDASDPQSEPSPDPSPRFEVPFSPLAEVPRTGRWKGRLWWLGVLTFTIVIPLVRAATLGPLAWILAGGSTVVMAVFIWSILKQGPFQGGRSTPGPTALQIDQHGVWLWPLGWADALLPWDAVASISASAEGITVCSIERLRLHHPGAVGVRSMSFQQRLTSHDGQMIETFAWDQVSVDAAELDRAIAHFSAGTQRLDGAPRPAPQAWTLPANRSPVGP